MKVLEHGMKVMERVLEKRRCGIVTVNERQFVFLPESGTLDAMFILGRLQEVYHAKGKGCMCFVDLEKSVDRVTWKVLIWSMRKK